MNLQLRWDLYQAAHSDKAKQFSKIKMHGGAASVFEGGVHAQA